jgi:hypothetical protein
MFRTMLNEFDPDKKFNQIDNVLSDDSIYIQADETLTRSRHFLNSLVDEWNDKRTQQQTAALAELDSSSKLRNLCAKFNLTLNVSTSSDKSNADELFCLDTGSFFSTANTTATSSSGPPSENGAQQQAAPPSKPPTIILPSPFPRHYHFELPIHKAVIPIVVRDSVDTKGHSTPDVGSVSSSLYAPSYS